MTKQPTARNLRAAARLLGVKVERLRTKREIIAALVGGLEGMIDPPSRAVADKDTEREIRREHVAKLYRKRLTQQEIVVALAEMGITASQRTVSRDVQLLRDRLREQSTEEHALGVADQLERWRAQETEWYGVLEYELERYRKLRGTTRMAWNAEAEREEERDVTGHEHVRAANLAMINISNIEKQRRRMLGFDTPTPADVISMLREEAFRRGWSDEITERAVAEAQGLIESGALGT